MHFENATGLIETKGIQRLPNPNIKATAGEFKKTSQIQLRLIGLRTKPFPGELHFLIRQHHLCFSQPQLFYRVQ
jgi:hypothetical protein